MNKLIHITKIIAFCTLTASLFTACGKNDPEVIAHSPVACDFVTINLTNNLDKTIDNLTVNGVAVGEVGPGDHVIDICLNELASDMGVYPYLGLGGSYEGELIDDEYGYCGVGLVILTSGTFEIEITEIADLKLYYSPI